ncbi:short-chain fatty acids transporter [Aminivibrio pyruvatiphilus]|uniref:Short-chain fatty acids transporter n=1 Tax=Aminivibrio pyruvatiphilus TaxID=1005740 RepID=A0A4R8M192_9BACT|nr:TIGR00366 family protein [Aminivibrio pyruvatiphilus]TDY55844.1 short-chain fatty acids transporter [Aminivibrio pyruvatiphilus]
MFRKLGQSMAAWSFKYIPDPSIFAVLLTFIAFGLGMALTPSGPMDMVLHWYKGFWELLTFSMQMALMVITASTVANAPAIKKGISALASIPKNSKQAVYFVALVSVAVSIVHWGLSLVLGALLAREVGRSLKKRNLTFEYGLIGAAAYLGQMTWHGGLSASVGLLIATPGHFLEKQIGIIPIADYMINPMNIAVTIGVLVFPPLFAWMIHPKDDEIKLLEPDVAALLDRTDEGAHRARQVVTVGDKMNNSKIIALLLAALGFTYIYYHFSTKGFNLDLNIVNAIFFFAGIALHGTMADYVQAVKDATPGVSGVIFQFPLYAGIMGMVRYSGLVDVFSAAIVSISTLNTFYLWTFISSSVVNLFVPSGGGQWAVQGPVAMKSAEMMGASYIKSALAVAYGNTWTNMLQPFWAIALLGITGLKARDVIGYATAVMILSFLVFAIPLLFLPV